MLMKILLIIAATFASAGLASLAHAQSLIVENGQPRAEIVIAQDCPRSTRLAAADLQVYVEKISGARLPISHRPGDGISIYVGQSEPARQLGITAEGLEHGAYRMVSGDNWLALIGDDRDFVPKEPWARNNSQRGEQLQARWEKARGLPYGVPNGGMYKNRDRMPEDLVREKGEYLWGYDERGSSNAVCGFLRKLGVRWYLPGELGEVVPSMKTIPLPKIDETVKPDFEFRQFNVRFGTADDEVMKLSMRLGIRNPYGLMIAHGMHTMTEPNVLKEKHPEWFALYGGKRDILFYGPAGPKMKTFLDYCEINYQAMESDKAKVDTALEFTSDRRTRLKILKFIGNNRETVLKDGDAALETYRHMVEDSGSIGDESIFARQRETAGAAMKKLSPGY